MHRDTQIRGRASARRRRTSLQSLSITRESTSTASRELLVPAKSRSSLSEGRSIPTTATSNRSPRTAQTGDLITVLICGVPRGSASVAACFSLAFAGTDEFTKIAICRSSRPVRFPRRIRVSSCASLFVLPRAPCDVTADDFLHDLGGTAVDCLDAAVDVRPRDRVFHHVAVSSV